MSEEFETFTKEERNYFDSKGEAPVKEAPVESEAEEEIEAKAPEIDEPETDEAETEPEAEERPKRDGRVALRKLRAEEERRKTAEKEAFQLREQFARADERLRMLYQASQSQQQPPQDETAPDPKADPIGAIEWQQRQIEMQRQAYEQQQTAQREQAIISQIDNGYRRAFTEFASDAPDAPEAYQHFTNALGKYFENLGVPEAQIDALVVQEERKLAYQAAQRGQNPAEIVYNLAKQFGYQSKPAESDSKEAVEKAEKDIDRRQKAAPASKSLSSASGSRGGRNPSMAELASMTDEEFSEMRSRMSDKEFRRLAGG
jgi:hypothetical protein